jgi:hypothetical protein
MLQLGTMYIDAIMPHVHIFTTHYGIHLQLVFNYDSIDLISMIISVPLLSTTIQLCYAYNIITYNLIKIHIH